jgi:hypothetical protein
MPEIVTAPASVSANSRKSEPVSPPWNAIGAYTAASVIVIAMIGPTSSRAPLSAASSWLCPSARWRSTFSTTTIASSTTRPTESTIASRVNRFRVNPNTCIRNTAPISETGIATTGTSTERKLPRKRKITITTINSVSRRVWVTSEIASSMYLVAS